jgi:hypothetical protein
MEFALLINAYYCYKQTQPRVEGPSDHLIDNLQYSEGIVQKFGLLSLFAHQFEDDML